MSASEGRELALPTQGDRHHHARPKTAFRAGVLGLMVNAGEAEPTRYFLSTLPADTSFKALVATVKMRWRIERDYRELKQEVGLSVLREVVYTDM